jgi:hypothetical protein
MRNAVSSWIFRSSSSLIAFLSGFGDSGFMPPCRVLSYSPRRNLRRKKHRGKCRGEFSLPKSLHRKQA